MSHDHGSVFWEGLIAGVVDAKTLKRRRRLFTLANEAFPDGRIPDPYTSVWLNEFNNGSMKDLPFICVKLVITPQDDVSDSPPEQRAGAALPPLHTPVSQRHHMSLNLCSKSPCSPHL
jgi:hypothetical protein